MHLLVLFLAAFLAGTVNSVAGGGTLLTFPALLAFGVPPIAANATSTVALVPGSFSAFWAYRGDLKQGTRELVAFAVPSVDEWLGTGDRSRTKVRDERAREGTR